MKKVLALLLVLVLALGMSTMAFAADKIDKDISEGLVGEWYDNITAVDTNSNGTFNVSNGEVAFGDIGPNLEKTAKVTEIKIPLLADNFYKDGTTTKMSPASAGATGADSIMSKADIKASKIVPKFKASKGGNIVDKVEIDGQYVKVKFKDPFKSNNPDGQDFDINVYLVVDGKNWSASSLTLTGTYKNEENNEADADTDWFDFSTGIILKPSEFIRTLEGDLGEGVIVNMRGLKNAKYWGVANQDMNDDDQALMIKYSAIDAVYHIDQIGIANVANFVTLEDADPTAYVYDKDLNPIGRGNSKLPLLDTYYLSANELDVDTELEPEEGGEEEPEYDPEDLGDNVPGGGDDLYPENPHDNPGTGK